MPRTVAEIDMIASLIKRLVPSLANFLKRPSDRFKKVVRLSTSLLITDAVNLISMRLISATMQGKRTSGDFAKSIYRFKDANPDYANSAIVWIFSIPESTLRGTLKRGFERSNRQKEVKLGQTPAPHHTARITKQWLANNCSAFLFWIGPY